MIELQGSLIKAELDNDKVLEYDWTSLKEIWSYATEDMVEHISAKIANDKLCVVLTAESGQTGIVAAIDIKNNKILDWFESPFAICATSNENIIYALNCVSRWGTEPYNYITVYNTDTKNRETIDIPYEECREDVSLEFVEGNLTIIKSHE